MALEEGSEDELPASKLGTRAHWNTVYERELEAYSDIGDEGEIWFGEDAVGKMADWIEEHYPLHHGPSPKILDVGTGNGHLLFELVARGYAPGSMTGIDYSEASIALSREIATKRGNDCGKVKFHCANILDKKELDRLDDDWDLILDKGTYDAICLSGTVEENESDPVPSAEMAGVSRSPRPMDLYPACLAQLLQRRPVKPNAKVLVTSCNWSEAELVGKFARAGFVRHSTVKWPTFQFGGVRGTAVCTVAFMLQDR